MVRVVRGRAAAGSAHFRHRAARWGHDVDARSAQPVADLHRPCRFRGNGAAGGGAGAIQDTVNQFRADLGGGLNPNQATTFETGRREINWDGVPDNFAAPNPLPPDFFNVNSPRGVVFSTPGAGFQVSANNASGVPVRFGNINANYPNIFQTFTSEKLFTALNSIQTTVNFFQAGTTTPATVNGFAGSRPSASSAVPVVPTRSGVVLL